MTGYERSNCTIRATGTATRNIGAIRSIGKCRACVAAL
jgi:hypothetical protein